MTNTFMTTELENCILDELINDDSVRCYIRHVDHTLLLVKLEDIDKIFNSIHLIKIFS